MNLTVEQVSRILNRLNICFTVDAAKRFIEKNLVRVPRPIDFHHTGYSYLIDASSLEQYLRDQGMNANNAHSVLYGN